MKKIWIVLASIVLLWILVWTYRDVPDDDVWNVRHATASAGKRSALLEMDSPFYIEFVRQRMALADAPARDTEPHTQSVVAMLIEAPSPPLESKTIAKVNSRFNIFSGNHELLLEAQQTQEAVVVSCNGEQFAVKIPSPRIVYFPEAGNRTGVGVGSYFIRGLQSTNTYELVTYRINEGSTER